MNKILKLIPDDVTVGDGVLADERLEFVIEKYQEFLDDGIELPEYKNDTTFKEIKENLNNLLPSNLLIEFTKEYKDNYLTGKELFIRQVRLLFIYFVIGSIVLSIISFLYGLLTGSLEPTDLINVVFDFFKSLFSIITDQPIEL